MTKEQQATEYAKSQIDQISEALEQAYLKGYEQAILDNTKVFNIDGVEYVDMALPSGTLWSRHPLMTKGDYEIVSYSEAANLSLPTKEQWEELVEHCALLDKNGFFFVAPSPSSERMSFDYWRKGIQGEQTDSRNYFRFWLKGADITEKYAPTMICCRKEPTAAYSFKESSDTIINSKDFYISTGKNFSGFKLPVFLVKSKTDIL